jgi:hypothetical protein
MRNYALLSLAVLLPLAVVAASSGLVFAQYSCPVQVSTASASTRYYGSNAYGPNNPWNIQMTMPISMSCPYMGGSYGQLWAVGNVYDTVTNTNVGSNNIVMNSNGGYYSGQLVFTLPSSVVEHMLQVSISVYSSYNNGQYGSLVATSSPTVTIHSSSLYNNNQYNNYPYSSYNSGYPNYYYQNGYNYPYNYYYSSPYYYQRYSCFNGQAIVYYNGGYYYASCYNYYHYYHHHP